LLKFHPRISTEFGKKRDKFQVKRMSIHPRRKIKQFHTQTNLPLSHGSDEYKIYCQSCGTNLGLKPHPKLKGHSDKCLVKISDQNIKGVRRSKSQTESEQNRFSKNKTSWLFFPVSSCCDSFMNVPPCLGANNIRKCLCEFFSGQHGPYNEIAEIRPKFHKFR